MSLKEQLKILQSKKQYAAMIALLEASNEPNRSTIIARIQLKMQEAARAEVEAKATSEPVHLPFEGDVRKAQPVKKKPSPTRKYWRLFLVLLVVATVIGIWSVATKVTDVFHKVGLSAYCRYEDKSTDCIAWRDMTWNAQQAVVRECYAKYEYPKYDYAFYGCLEDAGI